MKKNLLTLLNERIETIEYRAIKSELMKAAQNKRTEYRRIYLQDDTIMRLQNEGIKVTKINEFGTDKFLLSWALTNEERLIAKIKWAVSIADRHISVPQAELTDAENDAFVSELRSLGFHIQSAIA